MADKKGNGQSKKMKKFKLWKIIMITLAAAIVISCGLGAGYVAAAINTAPQISADEFTNNLDLTSQVYDMNGNFVESLHGTEDREYVSLSKIPETTQNAFLAIEDSRFYKHGGIDVTRIFGAFLADLKAGGKPVQGASTITQELIKNVILTPEKSIKRKIQEAYLSIKLEDILSKQQILEDYLNTIYFGGHAYGIQAASKYYFGVSVDKLDLAQSALIAGLVQSPSQYDPYNNEKTPDVYKNRQLLVLQSMLDNKMIDKDQYDQAKDEKLEFKQAADGSTVKYSWFMDSVISSVVSDLESEYSYTSDEAYQKIYSGGLKIYTTLDPKVQDVVDKVANDPKYYPQLASSIATWGKDKVIQPQIGIVITDYKTGQVRAVEGGRGEQPFRSENRAADPAYARQPGSAMKPLAVYGPAFDLGYSPASVIDDSPFDPEEQAETAGLGWPPEGPHNYDNEGYGGLTTIRYAVQQSLNTVASKLILKIGPDVSTDYIKKFGISTLVLSGPTNDLGPAKALGGLTKGVTPLEMSAAYGVFGNNGIYVQPILYTKVEDSQGDVLIDKTKDQDKHKVISPQAAYMMVDVMKDVITKGTGVAVRTKGGFTSMPSAGKTGTTENETDAYFAGLTAYYSGAIWMGDDNPNQKLTLSSSRTAWMWGDIMRQISEGLPSKDFTKPDGIVTASVCKDSGLLPTELCQDDPRGSRVITDIFAAGTVPTESCDVHVKAAIDTATGKLADEFTPPSLIQEKVFIKRQYPVGSDVRDYIYQLPTDSDPQPSNWQPPSESQSPGDGGNSTGTDTQGSTVTGGGTGDGSSISPGGGATGSTPGDNAGGNTPPPGTGKGGKKTTGPQH